MKIKAFPRAGKVIGAFYDSNGEETEELVRYRRMLQEGEKAKMAAKEMRQLYPPCNSEYKNKQSRVWCSSMRLVIIVIDSCY